MNDEITNIPKIRFKEYTEDWEQRKLSGVAEFNPKSDIPEKFTYVDLESVVGTYLIATRSETKAGAPSRAQRLARKGDIFYQTVRPYQKNNYLFDLDDEDYVFSTGYAQMRPNIDSYFLLVRVQVSNFVSEVMERSTGTSYPAINSKDLAKIKIRVPKSQEEQAKIGSLFKQLDDTIALHQRELDLLRKTKQTYLQKMFPKAGEDRPEIRFAGFTEPWEQRKLGEVVKINGRIGFRGYTQADIIRKEDGGILAFSPTNIINNKLDFNVKNTYITKDKYYESPEIMVKNGDILFVKTGSTLGKSASVSNLNEEATINPQIVILRANSYFISEFISSYLISNNILKQVAQTRIGGAVPTLTETEIKRFQISAPKGKEQQKIGTLFKQLDDTIALHQRNLNVLKEMKKSLLQQMFV